MPMMFQPTTWLFLGAGVIMLLAALRYQWRVWWPFRGDWEITIEESPLAGWIDRLRRRRRRRARRANDLAQAEARQRRQQTITRVLREITLARTAQAVATLVTALALWSTLSLPADATTATLWVWEPVRSLHIALTARADALGWWLAQVTLAVMLLTFVAQPASPSPEQVGHPRTRDYAWGLVTLGAFVHVVLCWDLIAFLVSWVILDVALFIGLAGSVREKDAQALLVSVAMSMVVTLALFWAILMVGPFEGTLFFSRASPILLEDRVLGMFLLAAVFRLTLYPFHLRFRHAAAGSPLLAVVGHLLPLLAGFYLLARLYALASGEMPGLGGVQALGMLSLIAGAVLIWRNREPTERLSYAFLSQAGGLVMVLTTGSPPAITAMWVGLLNLVLVASALFLQAAHPVSGRLGLALRLVPLASLAGLPPSLGFWGLWMRLNVALEWQQPGIMLLAAACHVSVMIALLRTLTSSLSLPPAGERPGPGLRWVALGLLCLPLALLGLWPPALWTGLRATVALVAGVPEPSLSITGLSPAADPFTPWLTLGVLLLALLVLAAGAWLGHWLHLPWQAGGDRGRRLAAHLGEGLDLAWAYRLGWAAFVGLNRLVAGLAHALDGHYALAWVVLLGFVLGLFLLGGELLP